MGIGNAVNTGFANNGILTIMSYYGEGTSLGQFASYLIGIAVAFFGAAILTYLVGFEEVPAEDAGTAPAPEVKKISVSVKEEEADVKVAAPVEGKAYPLNEVKDGGLSLLRRWEKELRFCPQKARLWRRKMEQ